MERIGLAETSLSETLLIYPVFSDCKKGTFTLDPILTESRNSSGIP
jgi:hypothetical protein